MRPATDRYRPSLNEKVALIMLRHGGMAVGRFRASQGIQMTREFRIGSHVITEQRGESFGIAEIGHNHQGKLETCKALFKAAADAGAHAVKLQTRDNRALFTTAMYDAPYDSENAYAPTYGRHRDFLEFDRGQYLEL